MDLIQVKIVNNSITEIATQFNNIKTALVFCHVRPDGDAIGAGLAIVFALRNLGKKAYFCCDEFSPEKFQFVSAISTVLQDIPSGVVPDTLISVDCADISRLGIYAGLYATFSGVTINIDHHISNGRYAKYNYVAEGPATCEILTEILTFCRYEITKDIANFLMLGLITDSGNFTHCDVSGKTYRTASILRDKGADITEINYQMYARQSKTRALLHGTVMSKMRFNLDGKFAFVIISDELLKQFNADKSITESFVDFPLTVDGVEVSASLLEIKKCQYKISLRSKGKVDVNAVATAFGGGGHVLASGCMIVGELEEVIEKLSYAVYQNL